LLVVDGNNHLSKQFLTLFYKWKALAHVKSLLPSAKGLSFYFYIESVNLFPSISSKHLSCYDSTIHILIYSIMFSIFLCLVHCFYLNEYNFESYRWP
jgi:hypothetical protein